MSDIQAQTSIDSHDSHVANTASMKAYDDALDALLNSPLHQARTKEALEKTAARRTSTISDMKTYMKRISLDDFPTSIDVVHITGTKGKGSTSCLCESILRRHYGRRTGLFTSPHLVDIRERIRINGQPVAKAVFGQVYWQVRERLEAYDKSNNTNKDYDDDDDLPVLPGYFRMLTLMALHTFANYLPRLDVIILEVGMGGRYDATNILDTTRRNVVCGVTLLDLDHTRVLGNTLEEIAWEKGGIFQSIKGTAPKSDIPTDTTTTSEATSDERFFVLDSNIQSVVSVFEKCAKEDNNERKIKLVGSTSKAIPDHVVIGLPGSHQRLNAELAVALSDAVEKLSSSSGKTTRKRKHTDSLYEALERATWPGRCQTVPLEGATLPTNLRLDGSHTPISLKAGYEWFCEVSISQSTISTTAKTNSTKRILVFNCSHERNPVELLQLLLPATGAIPFEKVYFCRSDFARPSAVTKANAEDLLKHQGIQVRKDLLPDTSTTITWQMTLESIWKHLEVEAKMASPAESIANLTVGKALNLVKTISNDESSSQVEVFAVGSLYIVGSALNAIGWVEREAEGIVKIN